MRQLKTYLVKKSLLLLVLFIQSCGSPDPLKDFPALNLVKQGSEFSVILPEDHRQGYNWSLVGDYDSKLVENRNAVWHGNEKGIYFNFSALSVGQTTLNFVSRRYTDTLDVRTFLVKINRD